MAAWSTKPLLAVSTLLALSSQLYAVEGLKITGNVRDIYMQSRTILDDKPYTHNLTRGSLVVDYRYKHFVTHVDYRQEVRVGSYFKSLDYKTFGLGQAPFYIHMENRLDEGENWQWNQGVYRGWTGLESDRAAFRVGRQRIAWGTGKIWNPTDVLNPYQPISVEREDRRGVDAVYLRVSLGELAQYEAAYAPQDTAAETQALERVRFHVGRADFSILGGKVAGDDDAWMIGGDFAADLFGGSLHGEITETDPQLTPAFTRGLIGYEYRLPDDGSPWTRDLWLLGEYYHNGAGARDPRLYNFVAVLSGRDVAMGREYFGVGITKDITPLWGAEVFAIRNLKDHSTFVGPAVKWNALTDLDILAGAQVMSGSKISEYGRIHTIYHLQAQLFFGS